MCDLLPLQADFPKRRLPCGALVRTHEDLVAWLLAKDPRLREATLPFEGCRVESNYPARSYEEKVLVSVFVVRRISSLPHALESYYALRGLCQTPKP